MNIPCSESNLEHDTALEVLKALGLTEPTEIVIELTTMWCKVYELVEPSEINTGMCEEYAGDLCELLPGAESLWNDDLDTSQDSGHCFTFYRDRYYDSECPEGVRDWRDLPFHKRETS